MRAHLKELKRDRVLLLQAVHPLLKRVLIIQSIAMQAILNNNNLYRKP